MEGTICVPGERAPVHPPRGLERATDSRGARPTGRPRDSLRALAGLAVLPTLAVIAWLALAGAPGSAAGSGAFGPGAVPPASVTSSGSGSSAAASARPVGDPARAAVTGSVASGAALYLQSCAACHGVAGAGTANAPAIANAGPALVDFVLRTGRMPLSAPGVPARRGPPAFGEQQIDDLVAYVASLGTGPAIPNVTTSGADIAQGRALFIQSCAACHGAGGAGGAVGGNVVAPPLTEADPRTVGEAVTTGPGPMPVFSFSPQQLDSLAAYVQSLRDPPSPGGLAVTEVGPVAEGFLAGTIGVLTLLVVARWIARGRPEDDEPDGTDEPPAAAADGSGATAPTEPGR